MTEIVDDVARLADDVAQQVTAGARDRSRARALEASIMDAIAGASDGLLQLSQMLDAAQMSRQDTEPISEAMTQVEQKLAFFQGCTMRRSSAQAGYGEEADSYAGQAERIAADARASHQIDRLVEAYKKLEGIEADILQLRGTTSSGSSPEPRVLDLPRARVLVARRLLGAAVVELDEEEEPD